MQPNHSSFACDVVVVVPVLAGLLLLVLLAVTSSALTVASPRYSTITAADRQVALVVIVTFVPALTKFVVYQISVWQKPGFSE